MADGGTETQERTLGEMLRDIEALTSLADTWDDAARKGAQARAEAIDDLNAEAFRRLIRHLQSVAGMSEALRSAASDEVIYAVLRRHGILRPSLFERVDEALNSVRPMLASHGGDAELVSVDDTSAVVRFLGACDGCPASALTFYSGVKKAIQEQVPQIKEVKQAKGLGGGGSDQVHFTSPFAAYQNDGWSKAADLAEVPDGETKVFEVDGHSVFISRFGDRVTCFENACAHMGMAMDGGEIADGFITCPYHQFQYSLESGECLTAPEVQLQPHGVRVVGDHIEIRVTK